MKWTEGHVWMLENPIISNVPYFQYKYVIMEDDQDLKWENGMNRIADLEMLASSTAKTNEFLVQQQKMMKERLSKMQHDINIDQNQSKSAVINDEWESYQIKFSVYQPLEGQYDMMLEGNKAQLERVVMVQSAQPKEWLMNKYGKKVRPYEVTVRMNQEELVSQKDKIYYSYSLKNFEQNDVIYEREPNRILEIQDPSLYRGELAA